MKTTEEMIAVMQAYADGKEIQCKNKSSDNWSDFGAGKTPLWNWPLNDYRVKPEPPKKEILPYESAEEFLSAQKEHGPYIKIENAIAKQYVFPICVDDCEVSLNKDYVSFETLTIMFYTWQDGTRVGKEVSNDN